MVVSIIVNYCCTQKKLKETETEETINFFVTFLSLVALQLKLPGSLQCRRYGGGGGGGRGSRSPPNNCLCPQFWFTQIIVFGTSRNCKTTTMVVKGVMTRGGVEDTRLKAKAKDTQKIRGQGQPFRGQTLSRPRTGMLEARDQEHSRKCSPKKKRSSKKFFRQSPNHRRSQNF